MTVADKRWSIWVLSGVLGPLVLVIRTRSSIRDNSFLWHVVAGRIQSESGAVLTRDPFSFTAQDVPWRTQSWLADVAYAFGVDRFGIDTAHWVSVAVGMVMFLAVLVVARRYLQWGPGLGVFMALTALVTLPFLNPRPVIFSYALLALSVVSITHPRLIWSLPLLAWAWAALHGSFPLILVLILLEAYRTRSRKLVMAGIGSLLTMNLTAHGTEIWSVLQSFSSARAALDRIQEWQPPDLLSLPLWPVIAGLLIVAYSLADEGWTRKQGIVAAIWFTFGLTANRSIPVMWLALAPVTAHALSSVGRSMKRGAELPGAALGLAALAVVVAPLFLPREEGLWEERFPLRAAEALTSDRVLHSDAIGGYLIFAQWPQRQVYVDDRAELYQDQYLAYTDAAAARPGWDEELRRWGIDQVLLEADRPLLQVLIASGWQEDYRDDYFVVASAP